MASLLSLDCEGFLNGSNIHIFKLLKQKQLQLSPSKKVIKTQHCMIEFSKDRLISKLGSKLVTLH